MRQLIRATTLTLALSSLASWSVHVAQAQIAVGCFQNQVDANIGADTKSYQDIYMSQGACTNFCRGHGTPYAITMDGSTCYCASKPPLDSNKVEDAKCDKPCMGYPFEMCGGTSSQALANVLLIGGATGGNPSIPSSSSSSSSSTSTAKDGNSSTDSTNGGKTLNANNPGTFSPGIPTPSVHEITDNGREKKMESGGRSVATAPPEDSKSNGPSAGAVAASTMAILGFAALFIFAVVFSKRRRQRLAQAAWTENMLLPSSLVHSSNDDELEGHDYTRSSPIYHHSKKMSQHSVPSPPASLHFPPPPVLHPRQSGALHMQHPSYPPPMMGPHYNNMRPPYQPFPMPPLLSQQHHNNHHQHPSHSHYAQEHLNHNHNLNHNHKEPLDASFNRGPQAIPEAYPDGVFVDEEDDHEDDCRSDHSRHCATAATSVRTMSIRHDRRSSGRRSNGRQGSIRGSIDTHHS
ncbi:hypothetical protein BGZ94_009716 [Podila epigama]|nr:hypothetical protein BGZ94_009716 [Podila epigama]